MAKKLSPMAVWGLVKELRTAAEDTRPLLVERGARRAAREGARARRGARRGARRRPRSRTRPCSCACSAGAPTEEDERELARRSGRGCRSSPSRPATEVFDIPYVLATDVVMCQPGAGFPVEEIAAAVARPARRGRHGAGGARARAARAGVRRADRAVLAPERDHRRRGLRPRRGLRGPDAEPDPARASPRRGARGRDRPERLPEVLATVGAGFGFRAVARQLLGASRSPAGS